MERGLEGLAGSRSFVSTIPPPPPSQFSSGKTCQEALWLRVVVSAEQTALRDFSNTFASAHEHVLFSWSILMETEVYPEGHLHRTSLLVPSHGPFSFSSFHTTRLGEKPGVECARSRRRKHQCHLEPRHARVEQVLKVPKSLWPAILREETTKKE